MIPNHTLTTLIFTNALELVAVIKIMLVQIAVVVPIGMKKDYQYQHTHKLKNARTPMFSGTAELRRLSSGLNRLAHQLTFIPTMT
jgi:hypothetical protein